jgi:hypothetical protein
MNKLKQPHELSTVAALRVLIYGQPGLGKTTFALSSPNPVLLDFDNGVHRVKPEHQVATLQVSNWKDVLDVTPELKPFKTIIIDTAGKMLDYLGAYIIQQNPKMGKSNGALSLQGYGERKAEFNRFVKQLSVMGKHIIFVAHEKEEKEGDNKYIRPEVGGSSGTDLYKELDLIGYMEAIGKKRTISFSPTEKYYAKNACGLNDIIELPELKDGVPNNYFETKVLAVYEDALKSRVEKVGAYAELMNVVGAKIEAVKDVETANEVLDWIEGAAHIWSSKLQAKTQLLGKVKALGLEVDGKTKRIVNAKKAEDVKA